MIARGLLFAPLLSLALSACAAPAPKGSDEPRRAAVELAPCRVPRSSEPARCATYEVPEDRAASHGRRISLKVVVLPTLGPTAAPDAIFVLVGGPGQGAASSLTGASGWLTATARRERDVVFVDQRGTGSANRLICRLGGDDRVAAGFRDLFPLDEIRACRENLAQVADLRLYTTPIAMDDLDEIRAALGYDRIDLYGTSYGSQAALQYLRQHPRRVRTVTLAGVATPDAKQPLQFARAAQDAMAALISDCAADAPCHTAFPRLPAEFDSVLASFTSGPVSFALSRAEGSEPIHMSRGVFVERLRLMLYDLDDARRVPLLIHRAAAGDWVPFATSSPAGVASSFSAMYMTVTCSETMAFIGEADVVRESRGTFVGEYRTRTHLAACREWPRADIPSAYYEPVRSDAPVLILSGELDAATPARYGAAAARSLPNSRQVLIRNASHAYWNDCTQVLVATFIARGSARDLDTGCVRDLRRPPFVTEETPPTPGGS